MDMDVELSHDGSSAHRLIGSSAHRLIGSSAHRLARRIEADIRSRGLRPGDRYLTAVKVGRALGVSTATACRAMRLMAEQDMLIRRRNRGTFVGAALQPSTPVHVQTVHLLLHESDEEAFAETFAELATAIHRELAGANVQFCFVPSHRSVEYVREVIEASQAAGQLAGVLAISCPRDVYRFLASDGVPTVVFGSLYPDQRDQLPSVDTDGYASGRLLTQYLVDRGHRRIGLITEAETRAGSDCFNDGISQALTVAQFPHNALIMRRCPPEILAYVAQARSLLEMADRPTAVIVRGERLAGTVGTAAGELGLSVPQDVEVVTESACLRRDPVPYPHVQPRIDARHMAALISGMLNRVSQGLPLEENTVVVEVEFRPPETGE